MIGEIVPRIAGIALANLSGCVKMKDAFGYAEYVAVDGSYLRDFMVSRRIAAFTWGACVIYRDGFFYSRKSTILHERCHVLQFKKWGIMLPFLYLAHGLYLKLNGGHWYKDNYFEVQARRFGSLMLYVTKKRRLSTKKIHPRDTWESGS